LEKSNQDELFDEKAYDTDALFEYNNSDSDEPSER
jgi:hypothetical protein